ncbi:DegT/DnrJ/EryC1/StrS family aminotransferase [Paenibacillus sp. GCM10027626]|uniref:DegT/DnrJ/EryC1/StrS family aminotransferase n=1 Tax=Paenibacillus sp. GCM10027626 TaxID=3273411 RepID=UPI0036407675
MTTKLAIYGGTPVRNRPLPLPFPGASVYGEEEKRAALDVIGRQSPFRYYGADVAGKTKQFEIAFSERIGCGYALGVTSGTAALVVALKSLGIGPGDKVIVPANTFIATANAVVMAGAVPVFADIDDSLNINPNEIGRLAEADPSVKAVIAVPILGNPCEMDKVMEQAAKHKLKVIEDVAQSCGSRYKGMHSGAFGDMACFSLQMNKIITTGDGGIVVTNQAELYERAVRYHDQGFFRDKELFEGMAVADVPFAGQNFRMSEINGAIALEQLKKLDGIIAAMRAIKRRIKDGIRGVQGIAFRKINDEEGDAGNALVMMLPDAQIASRFHDVLNAEGITASVLYEGRPVYMHEHVMQRRTADRDGFPFNFFTDFPSYKVGMCPDAEQLLPRCIAISLSPVFQESDADDVIKGILKAAEGLLSEGDQGQVHH